MTAGFVSSISTSSHASSERESGIEPSRYVDVVLRKHLDAGAPELLAPEVLQPGRRARALYPFARIAGVQEDVGVNEDRRGHEAWRAANSARPFA